MFKRILTALSIVLALTGQVVAKDKDELQELARRAGCNAPVYMYEEPGVKGFNAMYSHDWQGGGLHFLNFSRIPESWQLFIFYHEVGHCLQVQSGRMWELKANGDPNAVEWDADEYAILKLAEHRLDGAEVQAEALAEIARIFGVDWSDEAHGQLTHRIQNGRLNRAAPQSEM